MYSLDTYVNKFVPEGVPINYLSVDAEGHDYRISGGTRHGHEICRQIHHGKTWPSYVAPYHISNIWLLEPNSLFILTSMLKATRSPSDFWPPLPSNAGEREGALLPNPSKLKLRHASSTGLCIGLGVVPTGASLNGGFSTTQLLQVFASHDEASIMHKITPIHSFFLIHSST